MKGLKELWEKLKQGKHGQWLLFLLLLGVAGALLLTDMEALSGTTSAEKRISQVLSTMEGAGKVEVAIYYGPEKSDVWGDTAKNTGPIGAVVVAEGANDIRVRLALIRAAETLLGLDASAVEVFSMAQTCVD